MIIVDDESGIRTGLQCLDWEEFGIQILALCKNGLEAYEQICGGETDIVLTDIKMPVMDGIELISNIRKYFPHIAVVVLSGYDDFEYVKQCVVNNVQDYLLKPIDIRELKKTFFRVAAYLDDDRSHRSKMDDLERRGKIARKTLRDEFLRSLLFRCMTDEEIAENSVNSDVELNAEAYITVIFKLDGVDYKNYTPEIWRQISLGIEKNLTDYAEETGSGYAYTEKNDNTAYLIIADTNLISDRDKLKERVSKARDKIYSLKGIIKATVSCGIGLKAFGADEIFISANQARDALAAHDGENEIIFYEETDSDFKNQDYIISNAIQYIKNNFNKQITLMDVANSIYVNHTYLSYLFKKVTGSKFIDYLTDLRLEKAKELLSDPKYKVHEISRIIGYENPRYFSTVFKKHIGMTPYDYRVKGRSL